VSDPQQSNPVRRHVIYHGRVQGVCFRMISRDLSRGFQVVGFVRNLPDGTVELEAEGAPAEVDCFLAAIGREFEGNICETDVNDVAARGKDTDFRITY
jgi:acylphosphatase